MEQTVPMVLIMSIACLIVVVGWAVVFVVAVIFLNKRVATVERMQPHQPAEKNEMALLLYALCVFFWPAGFLLGFYFLKEARSARMGRVCAILGLVDISVIVILTCAGMIALAIFAPQWLPR